MIMKMLFLTAVLTSIRTIGTETSILTDPAKFPDQAREAVRTQFSKDGSAASSPQATSASPRSDYSSKTGSGSHHPS